MDAFSYCEVIPEVVQKPIVEKKGVLAGKAREGQKFGINVLTGQNYYVDNTGKWQPSPTVPSGTPTTPLTATIPSFTIEATLTDTKIVPLAGILLAKHYNYALLNTLPINVETFIRTHSDGNVRIAFRNETGADVVIPALTLSAMSLSL